MAESKTTAGHTRDISVADLRKRALSVVCGGALQWRKISILVDPPKISVVSKKKEEKVPCPAFYTPLGPFGYSCFLGVWVGALREGGPVSSC